MSGVSLPPAYSPDDFSSSCVSCQKAVASLNYVIRPSMPWGQKLLIRRFGSCSWAELLAPLAPSKGCARDASYSGKLKLLLQQAFTNSIRKQGKHTCSTRSRWCPSKGLQHWELLEITIGFASKLPQQSTNVLLRSDHGPAEHSELKMALHPLGHNSTATAGNHSPHLPFFFFLL